MLKTTPNTTQITDVLKWGVATHFVQFCPAAAAGSAERDPLESTCEHAV